jgi:hypothetical protein
MGYDPVAMAAYQDAAGGALDAIDSNGMTIGGAPASNALSFNTRGSYGFTVGGQGTALCVIGLCAGAYLLLHMDRVKVRV